MPDEPGNPRLGSALKATAINIVCSGCKHSTSMPIEDALRLWGRRTRLRDIAKDFSCRYCGKRGGIAVLFRSPAA